MGLSSLNIVGFVLKQLKQKGIDIADRFFLLPPLMPFIKTLESFRMGMLVLKERSENGCRVISLSLKKTYDLFLELILFLSYNSTLWETLFRRYFDFLKKINHDFANLQHKDFSSVDTRTMERQLSIFSNISKSDVAKLNILNLLDHLEELRLLLKILSEWTGQYVFFISKLPSKQAILTTKISQTPQAFKNGDYFYLSNGSNGSHSFQLIFSQNTASPSLIKNGHSPLYLYFFNFSEIVFFTKTKLFEPFILHFAIDPDFNDKCLHKLLYQKTFEDMKELTHSTKKEHEEGFKQGATATDFMVILSLFIKDLQLLRSTYEYYVSFFNSKNTGEKKTWRPRIHNPMMLLWLVAILGRFEIFKSITLPDQFDFEGSIGTDSVGTFYCKDSYYTRTFYEAVFPNNFLTFFSRVFDHTPSTIPLMLAAKWNRIDVIEGLLDLARQGKRIGLTKKDTAGHTAAEIAFYQGHDAAARLIDSYAHTLSEEQRKILYERRVNERKTPNTITEILQYGKTLAEGLCETTSAGVLPQRAI